MIKTFFLGTAVSNVIGNSWAAALLYDVQALSHQQAGVLQINLGEFPDLSEAGGSVRIGTSPVVRFREEDVRQTGIFPPVLINRGEADDFYVMSAECSHESCTVNRMNRDTKIMTCPCHGSQYFIDGSVRRDPARQPLRTLPFSRAGDTLQIQMPDVFYEVKALRTPAAGRMEITFIGFIEIKYELYFRANLTGPFERVHFSTTPDGPLDQLELPGADDFAKIYVERPGPSGFFQVAMKTGPV